MRMLLPSKPNLATEAQAESGRTLLYRRHEMREFYCMSARSFQFLYQRLRKVEEGRQFLPFVYGVSASSSV